MALAASPLNSDILCQCGAELVGCDTGKALETKTDSNFAFARRVVLGGSLLSTQVCIRIQNRTPSRGLSAGTPSPLLGRSGMNPSIEDAKPTLFQRAPCASGHQPLARVARPGETAHSANNKGKPSTGRPTRQPLRSYRRGRHQQAHHWLSSLFRGALRQPRLQSGELPPAARAVRRDKLCPERSLPMLLFAQQYARPGGTERRN